MASRWTILIVGVVATVAGFLLESAGPVGKGIWPMAASMPDPEGANLALLMVMGGIEAAAFGLGFAFLVAAWPWARSGAAGSPLGSWLVYLSIGWLLVNWVPHTALHMAHGNITKPSDYAGLVGIEYGFHLTLILAGAAVAWYAVRSIRVRSGDMAAATGAPTPATRKPN